MLRRIALIFMCVAAAHGQTDWRFAHPDADFQISVNLQALIKSPAVAQALKQIEEKGGQNGAQVKFVVNLLSSIDRFALSARQKPGGAGAPTPAANSDALMLVSGSFDPQTIKAIFPSTGPTRIQQAGPNAILIGEGASFTQALGRMSRPPANAPADELEQSDIWIWGGSGLMKAAEQAPPAFKSLTSFSMGVNFTENPEANMILSAADAAGAAQVLAGFHELLAKSVDSPEKAALLDRALKIGQEGSRIRFRFVTPPELIQAAQQQAASGSLSTQLQTLMGMLGIGGPGVPPAPRQAPANGGKITIYGLDDGPREVKPQERPPGVVTLPPGK